MIETIVLAIIQGISEFLPISSSAHLIIFRDIFLFGKDIITENMALTFDIALHFGTALAILVFFFKDFVRIIKNGFAKGIEDKEGKLMWLLIVATIPAACVGVLFQDVIDDVVRSKYWLIALALIVMGIVIYYADKTMTNKKSLKTMTLKDAVIIGFSQIFALIPGFSRSGTTIAASRMVGLSREDSAKFSFYLAEPIILGAVVMQLFRTNLSIITNNIMVFITGIIVSFIVGIFCIKLLLKYLKNNDFKIFMWYRLVLGVIVLLYILL